jgi:hypothetical protein
MADDEFKMTYPCYFLYAEGGESLQCNVVDGHVCLCLFTTQESVQRFYVTMLTHDKGPQHGYLQVPVDTVEHYAGLVDRLKSAEARLAGAGINFIAIDPIPGQPVMYTTIRDFIDGLPR